MRKRQKEFMSKQTQSRQLMNLRYTDKELELISSTFSENEELIMIIRKFFLQGQLTAVELAEFDKFKKSETVDVLQKTLLPEIDPNSPLHQNIDMWCSIDTINKGVDEAYLDMQARQIVVDYFEQQFDVMNGFKVNDKHIIRLNKLVFDKKKDAEEAYIDLKARNTILQHVDLHLNQLKILAGQKPETPEEIKERLYRDSSK
jgi:hypothetical protein